VEPHVGTEDGEDDAEEEAGDGGDVFHMGGELTVVYCC
jgi:hypothetical protein